MWDERSHCHGSRSRTGEKPWPHVHCSRSDNGFLLVEMQESMETAEVMQVWLPASQKLKTTW